MALQFETISALYQASGVGPSITVPAPAGLIDGDLLVAIGAVFGTTIAVITLPSGWAKNAEDGFAGFPTGFVATKKAAGEGANFTFSQNLGGNEAWTVGIYRLSGALGFDSFKVQIVGGSVPGGGTTDMILPSLTTVADNVLRLVALQVKWSLTEPTSLTDPGSSTRRAFIGGPNVAGAADPLAAYYTDDIILTPPGSHSARTPRGVQNGATGAKTSASYSVGIAPLLGGGTPGEMLRETVQRVVAPPGAKIKNPFRDQFEDLRVPTHKDAKRIKK